MNILEKNYNNFINTRIDETINYLRKNNKTYKNNLKEYKRLYKELYNELSTTQIQKLDKLLNILNSMSGDELTLTYKNATHDFFYLKNHHNIQ